MYSNESNEDNDVDLVQLRVLSQKTRDVERIPPTSDALYQHLKRNVFQASIWTTAQRAIMPVNSPTNHGWKEEGGKLLPIWISLHLTKDVFQLDVKCTCTCTCSRHKCVRAKLEVHTSVQVQMREVAGSEPFLTCIYGLFVRHFLIKTIVQGVIQGIASAGILLYIVVQLKDK